MRKYTKAGLTVLLAGVMLASNTAFAFAAPDQPVLISASPISAEGPGSAAPAAEETQTSGVILAGQSRVQEETGGPGSSGSSPVITAPQGGTAPAETTSPAESQAPAEVTSPEGTAAESTVPEGTLVPADAETQPELTGETAELTPEQAAQLEAEQAAAEAAAAANASNNPLVVPDREPHLQSTILLNDAQTWSQAYVNDQEISGDGQSFSSISTFLENIHGNILYRTYSASNGWSAWALNGQETTHNTAWVPVEAIQYRFAGPVANKYDIYYSTVLSDGTRTGWAKNGETAGTMNTGLYLTGFRLAFFVKGTAHEADMDTSNALVSAHADGIQYIDGVMRYIHGDGSNYTGWGWIGSDRYYFVDSYPVTGWQYIDGYKYYFQEDGKMLSDVEPIIGNGGPFQIKINKEMNCMTIYAKDGDNGFIIPVKSFLTSVGDDTPIGTFTTPEKYRWRLMIHDVYTQYATRLGAGLPILMHSIIYDAPNPYTVWASTYNNMGIARSAGCIRLVSGDAKWVYDNCPLGTTVTVYNSPIVGPFERPTIAYEIPFEQTWDPTDPNVTAEGIAAESARIIAQFN